MDNTQTYAAGELDPDFTQLTGTPGWVDILRALGWSSAQDLFFSALSPTPEGKLYACGYFAETVSSPVEYFIARLDDNGQRDLSFGDGGYIRGTFPINFKMVIPTRLTLQRDGKILMQALGHASTPIMPDPILFVARFLASGAADPAFADNGLMRHELPVGRYNFLTPFNGDMQSLPDGRVLACNTGISYSAGITTERAVLYRLTAQGAMDTTFNLSGVVELGVPGASLRANGFVIQPDNKVVVAGQLTYQNQLFTRGVLARLDAAGQLDTTFGPSGTGLFEFELAGEHVEINSIAARADGMLVAVGTSRDSQLVGEAFLGQGLVMAVTADGLPDSTFNNGELLLTPVTEGHSAQWVVAQFQDDGKLLLAGRSNPLIGGHYDTFVYLARYMPNGTPDINFGQNNNGLAATMAGGFNNVPIDMQQQRDAKILVGVNAGSFRKGTLLRYLNG